MQAGRELAIKGSISGKTAKRANQQIIEVPFLNILLKIKPLKSKMIKKAKI